MNLENGYISYIVNPGSGSSSASSLIWDFREYLQFRGFDVKVNFTKSLEHAQHLAKESVRDDDCKLIIASGGDGTIRDIAEMMIGSEKPLMPLPGGTENLLASELGYDEKLTTMTQAFDEGYTVDYDLCKIGEKYFASIAGFGFDAEVVHRLAANRKGNINHTDYFWPLWRTYWSYKFPSFKIEIDGEEIFDGPCLAFVGNLSRYAMGLHILRNAVYNDGLVDLCIYDCSSHLGLAKNSLMTVLKLQAMTKTVIYRQGKQIKISSSAKDVYCQIDGDPGPALPVEINVLPGAVKLVVPKDKKPAGLRTRIIRMFQ